MADKSQEEYKDVTGSPDNTPPEIDQVKSAWQKLEEGFQVKSKSSYDFSITRFIAQQICNVLILIAIRGRGPTPVDQLDRVARCLNTAQRWFLRLERLHERAHRASR